AAEWHAPVSRNVYEWHWLRFAHQTLPRSVPRPLAHDEEVGALAMEFLEPVDNPVWKTQLLQGEARPEGVRSVGRRLARRHAASPFDPVVMRRFDTSANFLALRIEPYLPSTTTHHPRLASPLRRLAQRTIDARIALVHGDVSPKNILVGASGPVFLDAECAWFG